MLSTLREASYFHLESRKWSSKLNIICHYNWRDIRYETQSSKHK
jgi:hypothetical protein